MEILKTAVESVLKIIGWLKTEKGKLVGLSMAFVLAFAIGGWFLLNSFSEREAEREKVLAELRSKHDEAEARNRADKERLEHERNALEAELQARLSEKIVDAKGMGTDVSASGSDASGSAFWNGNEVTHTSADGTGGIAMANSAVQNSTVSYVVNNFGSMGADELRKAVSEMTKQEGTQVVEALKGSGSKAAVSLVNDIFAKKFSFSGSSTAATAQSIKEGYCRVSISKIVPGIGSKGNYWVDVTFFQSAPASGSFPCDGFLPYAVNAWLSDKDAVWKFIWDEKSGFLDEDRQILASDRLWRLNAPEWRAYRLVWQGEPLSISDISKLNVNYLSYSYVDYESNKYRSWVRALNGSSTLQWSAADGKIARVK